MPVSFAKLLRQRFVDLFISSDRWVKLLRNRTARIKRLKVIKLIGISILILLIFLGTFFHKGPIPADVVDAKYSNQASQFLTLDNGTRIHFRDQGARNGEVIVLIHGSSASLHTFEPWVAILGDEFRIVTLDLPGHGLTGGVPDNDYSSAANISSVNAIVTTLGLDYFTLGGNSMGGGVVWRYALVFPDKVKAMILIDASGPPAWWQLEFADDAVDSEERETPIIFELLTKPWFRAIATNLDSYYFVKQGVEAAYNHSAVVDDELIARYYELSLRKGSRVATLNRFANFNLESDETYDLQQLEQPTLIMWGREDALVPVKMADKFRAELPQAEVVIFDKVGHIPMEEIPVQSADTIRRFMNNLKKEQDEAI